MCNIYPACRAVCPYVCHLHVLYGQDPRHEPNPDWPAPGERRCHLRWIWRRAAGAAPAPHSNRSGIDNCAYIHVLHASHTVNIYGVLSSYNASLLAQTPDGDGTEAQYYNVTVVQLELPRAITRGALELRENLTRGQSISNYTVEHFDGTSWALLPLFNEGCQTIGNRRIQYFTNTTVQNKVPTHAPLNWARLLPGNLQPYHKDIFAFSLLSRLHGTKTLFIGAGTGDCGYAAIGVRGTRATAFAQHEDHGLEQPPARWPADRHPCSQVSINCRGTRTNTRNACLPL